jgi:hypothetical protein
MTTSAGAGAGAIAEEEVEKEMTLPVTTHAATQAPAPVTNRLYNGRTRLAELTRLKKLSEAELLKEIEAQGGELAVLQESSDGGARKGSVFQEVRRQYWLLRL